jgi:sulfoxide reductase heme-binding subunit YedZ
MSTEAARVRAPAGPALFGATRLMWLKPGVFLGALVPLAYLVRRAIAGALGADPIAAALNELGLLALVFLVATLACTPLKIAFNWTWPLRIRRMLGLFAFFYASLHFGTYAVIDQGLDLAAICADVAERPFITVGFAAFVLLIPLAITSTTKMRRRLGPLRWQKLHRLIYLIGPLAALHFFLRVKRDLDEPLNYAFVIAFLLGVRLWHASNRAKRPIGE